MTAIAKLMPANFSILISKKFKNQNLSKAIDKGFEKFGFSSSCLGHFLHVLGITVSNMKRFSVFLLLLFIFIFILSKNRTNIFLLKIPLIEQFRGLIGE